jgi:hypothetical protein
VRPGGGPCLTFHKSTRAGRSKGPKMASLDFLAAFSSLRSRRRGGATGVLFRVPTVPRRRRPADSRLSTGTAGCACLACRALSLPSLRSLPPSCTISAPGLPPLWQEKRPPQTSWTLAPKRTVTRGGRTGKKTVIETATSTRTRPRKIKTQRWVTM